MVDDAAPAPSLIEHYGRVGGVATSILRALEAAGIPLEPPLPRHVLSGVDEFHLGGAAATAALLEALTVRSSDRVLDVGCGVGGPARSIAAATGCAVTGIDLTPSFVEAAERLTALTDLADRVGFRVADASSLDEPDGAFSAATMLHVGMNLPDKPGVFAEVKRVLRDEGCFVVYDIMRTSTGELTFPLPWSATPGTDHLATPDVYGDALRAEGFTVEAPIDRSDLVVAALERTAADPPPVTLTGLMGPDFPEMFANLLAAFHSGVVAPIQIVARC